MSRKCSPEINRFLFSSFPVECSFEETNPPLCGWTNVKGAADKFDWSIGQGKTSSINTGPPFDHTYNDNIGNKLFRQF